MTFQSPKDGEDKGGGSPLKKGAGSVKKDGAAGAEKNEDFEDGGVPLIYLCATCWHETEGEMLSLLKSLFRWVGWCGICEGPISADGGKEGSEKSYFVEWEFG